MTTLTLEIEPLATQVSVTEEKLIVDLVNGQSLIVPLSWYPRLLHASQAEPLLRWMMNSIRVTSSCLS
ncbi:MAG: DUF2442 domain-containing protein [Leptolyngbyaceae cyanobacterium SL_7_1]|nr:DUF2442 domain-containing protein [Leptolyngbyaceae cyanobacterium SL_7_1]